jgi:hypothetical protein
MNQSHLALEFADEAPLVNRPAEVARLRMCGAGLNELEAVARITDTKLRGWLIDFFCLICPENFRLLRAFIALVLYESKLKRKGADVWVNMARGMFDPHFNVSNDVRCFFTRAALIVRPDLTSQFKVKPKGKMRVLSDAGWKPSAQIDWQAVPPLTREQVETKSLPK